MAKKTPAAKSKAVAARQPVVDENDAIAVKTTPARKSSVPPKAKAKSVSSASEGVPAAVTSEMIAERAYHLWRSGMPGGELDHWIAAERELRTR